MLEKLKCLVHKYSCDDYYVISKSKKYINIVRTICVVVFFSFFFYRSIWGILALLPIGIIYYYYLLYREIVMQKEILAIQFKEFIISMASNLRAGYSTENSIIQSQRDLKLLFSENSLIHCEIIVMIKGMQNNYTLEELFIAFGKKSNIEEIKEFANVFSIVKRSGGNLILTITDTTIIISDRLEMQKESLILISGKRFEQKIMSLIPFFIAIYIEIFTPGYFDMLYGNVNGILIMTICLLLYIVAYGLSQKIIDIKE